MKLVSEYVLSGFYGRFSELAAQHGAFTRVQCCGSPTNLLRAYSLADVPETEAILYEPAFARIPASAAAAAGKPVVSSETFTCLYGWRGWPGPGPYQGRERIADLKLLADALFASGVNHIVWHGTPYNDPGDDHRFFASVHVGRRGSLAPYLRAFNAYMEAVCSEMRRGRVYSDVAVYLPLEDAWMGVDLPDSLKFPWAWGEYEMRYQRVPVSLAGRQPLWVNARTLRRATVRDGTVETGDCRFTSVYVDATWLDVSTVRALQRVAENGVPVHLRRRPAQPGLLAERNYAAAVDELLALPAVTIGDTALVLPAPLLEGRDLPPYWCRVADDGLRLFFAHPAAGDLSYPLAYGAGRRAEPTTRKAVLNWNGLRVPLELKFRKTGSLLLRVDREGQVYDIGPAWDDAMTGPASPTKRNR
jgi:hypothetical protein